MKALTVGRGQQFERLSDAIKASQDGDRIEVQAGTYTNDFATITNKISIVGVGGMVHLQATTPPPQGKAILITQDDVTFENIEFSGGRVSAGNGAGIRHEGGDLVLKNTYFHDNEMHILSANGALGDVTILDSEFGVTRDSHLFNHGVYIGQIQGTVTIRGSYLHDPVDGNPIKSRAAHTIIASSRIVDGNGAAGYTIDLPNGGDAVIRGNMIVQSVSSPNASIIHFGGDYNGAPGPWPGSSLLIEDNVIQNYRSNGVGLLNQTSYTAVIKDNQLYNLPKLASGPHTRSGNTTLSSPIKIDTSHPWQNTSPKPDPTLGPVPLGVPKKTGADALSHNAAAEAGAGGGCDGRPTGGIILHGASTPDNASVYGWSGNDVLRGGIGDDAFCPCIPVRIHVLYGDGWMPYEMSKIREDPWIVLGIVLCLVAATTSQIRAR